MAIGPLASFCLALLTVSTSAPLLAQADAMGANGRPPTSSPHAMGGRFRDGYGRRWTFSPMGRTATIEHGGQTQRVHIESRVRVARLHWNARRAIARSARGMLQRGFGRALGLRSLVARGDANIAEAAKTTFRASPAWRRLDHNAGHATTYRVDKLRLRPISSRLQGLDSDSRYSFGKASYAFEYDSGEQSMTGSANRYSGQTRVTQRIERFNRDGDFLEGEIAREYASSAAAEARRGPYRVIPIENDGTPDERAMANALRRASLDIYQPSLRGFPEQITALGVMGAIDYVDGKRTLALSRETIGKWQGHRINRWSPPIVPSSRLYSPGGM